MGYYDRYRGSRQRRRKRLLVALLCVLLLLVLLAAAFFLLQEHVIFMDDGTVRFDFLSYDDDPGAAPIEPDEPDEIPVEDIPLIIDGEPAEPSVPDKPSVPDEPVVSDEPAAILSALLVTPEQVLAGLTLPEGYDAVAVTVKDADGLCWVEDPHSAGDGTAADSAAFLAALDGLSCRKVAVIHALRDPIRPRTTDRASACKVESGTTWLDWDYCSWFSPYAEGTGDYLLALLDVCERAGFDEAVLLDFQFPVRGRTELLSYGEQALSQTDGLTALAARVSADSPLPVSCLLSTAASQGGADEPAGQDAAALAGAFGKVWVRCSSPADADGLRASLGDEAVALWLSTEGESPLSRIVAAQ